MIIGSKNKGDWSEFYTLLYLLATRKLETADEHLNKINHFCLPIKKIIRKDVPSKKVDFILDKNNEVSIVVNGTFKENKTSEKFKEEARFLYDAILRGRGSIKIPHSENFLNELELERLAAPSTDITDITIELHDTNTGIDQIMGFSIKSYIGGAPTLLNASEATNFVYEITGINDQDMDTINAINSKAKIVERIKAIYDVGGSLKFYKTHNYVFYGNLMMIDSNMEDILAELLLYSYTENVVDCKQIIDHLEKINPLNYPRKGMYIYKFKQFLCAKALGMNPSKEWSGEDDANGGYIVVKSNGEVLAYHLYNRDKFKEYLFDSTKLERGSTSRHKYAQIYKENGKFYINLNLQIRFK